MDKFEAFLELNVVCQAVSSKAGHIFVQSDL